MKRANILIILVILFTSNALAQFGMSKDLVKIETYQSFDKVYAGTEFKIAVKTDVADTWHINSDKPYDEYLIPTSLIVSKNPNFKLTKVAYPKPHDFKFSFSESPLSVWEGQVYFGALVQVDSSAVPGVYSLIIELEYQACNDMSCQAPTAVIDTINIEVADKTSPVNTINDEIFKNVDINFTETVITEKVASDPISNALESQGLLIGLLLVFLGGLALNLTPCVYPLIPITVGYFGGQSEGSTTKLFFMGILFILGLAVTYSAIGVVTSLTGAIFGALLQNPIVILIIVAIMLALSLSMFGVYEFKLPDSLVNKAGGAKGG
ncbi:MAG TPA: cytochrome c biogenesis protein CcdA, partial [Ignavibacteriaceae bacterium]